MDKNKPIRRKLVIIGDGACGKFSHSDIFLELVKSTYYVVTNRKKDYQPTVFENYVSVCKVDGKHVQLALWDTAGQEDYERLRPLSYNMANVIIIAFAVNAPDSLDNVLTKWHDEVQRLCPRVPIILVGLKKDLRTDPDEIEEMRKKSLQFVQYEQAQQVAHRIGAKRYIECSALTGENVDSVFEAATRTAMLFHDSQESATVSCCVVG